jgi:transposase
MEIPMQNHHDNSKACPAAFVQDSTLVAVIEMSLSSWLVAGMIPGVSRDPLKKIDPNPDELLRLLHRWRDEAVEGGKEVTRIAVAYETGRDSFWLARWLRSRGIDAHVIHATSVAISREHRRLRRIESIRRCCGVVFLAGYAESLVTVAWQPSRPWRRRMPNARTVSVMG